MEPFICPWDTYLWFFADSVPRLLYYSHLPGIMVAVLIASLLFFNKRKTNSERHLILLLLLFSFWSIIDLFLWANNRADLTLFFWSIQILVELFVYVVALLFVYTQFNNQQYPSFKSSLLLFVILLPAIILLPTNLYLVGISDQCSATESLFIKYFSYLFEIIISVVILFLIQVNLLKQADSRERKKVFLNGLGIVIFLLAFASGNIIGSFSDDWQIAQYGLFGMPIFVAFLGYLIVEYRMFSLNIIGAQALVASLWFLIGSLLLVVQSSTSRFIAGVTLLVTTIVGYFLIRSVKREVLQREEIAKLADTLAKANDRLKVLDKMKSEFVSIASHQLRSPLTSIRGYASMLAEGSYGKLPAKAKEVAGRIAESSKFMALSVEDYLNVSRIEAGNMKYEMSDFNLKDVAQKIVDELRPGAIKKGLILVFRSDCDGSCSTHADIGKVRQVIMNLLDNALKYTPKGTVTVVAHDNVDTMKMCITIQDTGVGMSAETLEGVFEKFMRAKNANCVNVTGTGLGLYVAKKMITDMGGRVWAESEGEGKGSTFHIELPLIAGKPSMR